MSRQVKQLTVEDASWFNIERYAPGTLGTLPLETWVGIVSDRVHLRGFLRDKAQGPELLLRFFEPLQTDPLSPLGFSYARTHAPDDSDTASVELLRVDILKRLSDNASYQGMPDSACYDRAVAREQSIGRFNRAHISVDLNATTRQIKTDFAHWLAAYTKNRTTATNRVYSTAVKAWSVNSYLPYFDLWLFAQGSRCRLTAKTVERLFGRRTTALPWDTMKTAAQSLEIFTDETLAAMRLECGIPVI